MSDNILDGQLSNSEAITKVKKSTSASEAFGVIDQYYQLGEHASSSKDFGVSTIRGVSQDKARLAANKNAMNIVERFNAGEALTSKDLDELKAYTGRGGISDTTSEYYTPQFIAEGTWDAIKANGFENGNVCEPSCGTGVFNGTKPKGVIITGAEVDETSSTINTILHPEDTIQNVPFEKLALSTPNGHFDSFVGNVPFGGNRADYAELDPQYAHIDKPEHYFIHRAIDKTKAGGLIALIVPTRIVSGVDSKLKAWRRDISLKAEFLGAHRMPSKVFSDAGTPVVTDLIILQKHSDDLYFKTPTLEEKVLKESKVLWSTFIAGQWFEKEGKRFIMGDQTIEKGFRGDELKVDGKGITSEGIKKKLSQKFNSRIDLSLIEASEPTVITNYSNGDKRLINNSWYEFQSNQWVEVKFEGKGGSLDKDKYGGDNWKAIKANLRDEESALNSDITFTQLKSIRDSYPSALSEPVLQALRMAEKHNDSVTIYRAALIGSMMNSEFESPSESAKKRIIIHVKAEHKRTGIAANNKALTGLGRDIDYYINASNKKGVISDYLLSKREATTQYDLSKPNDVIKHLFSELHRTPISLDEINNTLDGEPITIEDLAKFDDVAISTDGLTASPLNEYATGNISAKYRDLLESISYESNPVLKAKFQQQADTIDAARKHTKIDDIDFGMTNRWIPPRYIQEFLETQDIKVRWSKDGSKFITQDWGDAKLVGNFLNHETLLGKHEDKNPVKRKIERLEKQFGNWMKSHDDAEFIRQRHDLAFHGNIEPTYSDKPLELSDISGSVVNMPFQRQAIRRMSDKGGGILAFGTGLGKSHTANGLAAFDLENGRATKICYAVPKSVLINWYHETKHFFGSKRNVFFVGLDQESDKDGNKLQEPWLDKDGNHKKNSVTGELEYRAKVKILSADAINTNLAKIPHNGYHIVVMTKEQLKRIPMRPATMEKHVDAMVENALISSKDGITAMVGKGADTNGSYKSAKKREGFQSKFSSGHSQKDGDLPFWEDMKFDKIIVDEGHNYRNSYSAADSSRTNKIANLPKSAASQVSLDLAIKSEVLKASNDGRGVVMLTATPTVNSPTDIFNMLSHVMDKKEWDQYGIKTVDDFVALFAKVELIQVSNTSGVLEETEALTGFKNLDILRSIWSKHVDTKDSNDVKLDAKMPEKVERHNNTPLNEEQEALYEEVRDRAEELANGGGDDLDDDEKDHVFTLIREMDRISTDPDMYHKVITFILPKADAQKLDTATGYIPDSKSIKIKVKDKIDGKDKMVNTPFPSNATVTIDGDNVKLVIDENFEKETLKAFKKAGIDAGGITHPITPKYAKLIENLKVDHATGGKQVIFTEEKRQHAKLRRIIAANLDIDISEIGIINSDTVKGTSSKDSETEVAKGTIEDLANNFNTGKFKILICNKKAEVGINLQHGSTRLHHLTIPWTPAAIKQRNGRIRRIGGTQESVTIDHYLAVGSFDEFRLERLTAKAAWQDELTKKDGANSFDYEASNDNEENKLLLSRNPEELKAKLEAEKAKKLDNARLRAMQKLGLELSKYKSLSAKQAKLAESNVKLSKVQQATLDSATNSLRLAFENKTIPVDPTKANTKFAIDAVSGKTLSVGDIVQGRDNEASKYSGRGQSKPNLVTDIDSNGQVMLEPVDYGLEHSYSTASRVNLSVVVNFERLDISFDAERVKAMLEGAYGGLSIFKLKEKASLISKDEFLLAATEENYKGYPTTKNPRAIWQGNELVMATSLSGGELAFPDLKDSKFVDAVIRHGLAAMRKGDIDLNGDEDLMTAVLGHSYERKILEHGSTPDKQAVDEWKANTVSEVSKLVREKISTTTAENASDLSSYTIGREVITPAIEALITDQYENNEPLKKAMFEVRTLISKEVSDHLDLAVKNLNEEKRQAEAKAQAKMIQEQEAARKEREAEEAAANPVTQDAPAPTPAPIEIDSSVKLTQEYILELINDKQALAGAVHSDPAVEWLKRGGRRSYRVYINLPTGKRGQSMFINTKSMTLNHPNKDNNIIDHHDGDAVVQQQIKTIVLFCKKIGVSVGNVSDFYDDELLNGE